MLGKPQQIDDRQNELLGKERYLYYNKRGIHGIQLIQNPKSRKFEIFSLLVNHVGSVTHDGIKIGDTRLQLLKVYGTPNSIDRQGDDVQILTYSSTAIPANLSFTLLNDRITEIKLERIKLS